mmetsp:Transcript_24177/g.53474  ORF Transcript_24177/g.53474 Transcript_24177/m.53474 type:complete len:207 (+) Transcript_24177:586-1206(+)
MMSLAASGSFSIASCNLGTSSGSSPCNNRAPTRSRTSGTRRMDTLRLTGGKFDPSAGRSSTSSFSIFSLCNNLNHTFPKCRADTLRFIPLLADCMDARAVSAIFWDKKKYTTFLASLVERTAPFPLVSVIAKTGTFKICSISSWDKAGYVLPLPPPSPPSPGDLSKSLLRLFRLLLLLFLFPRPPVPVPVPVPRPNHPPPLGTPNT